MMRMVCLTLALLFRPLCNTGNRLDCASVPTGAVTAASAFLSNINSMVLQAGQNLNQAESVSAFPGFLGQSASGTPTATGVSTIATAIASSDTATMTASSRRHYVG